MNEFDVLMTGAVGGFLSGAAIVFMLWGQMRWAYDKKLEAFQLQLLALRVELNNNYDSHVKA